MADKEKKDEQKSKISSVKSQSTTDETVRKYKRANGTEATYKVSKAGTANDALSSDLEATIKSWEDEGCVKVEPTKAEMDKVKLSSIVRYITKDNKVRRGGNLTSVGEGWVRLLNPIAGVSWSVQFGTTKAFYVRPIKGKKFFEKKEKK